jgi:hypothetical protein
MNGRRFWLAALLAFLTWSSWSSAALGQVPTAGAARDLAQRLLNEGWDRSARARNDSQQWFEQASPAAKGSAEVRWAYALNRLHHRKYRDAKPFVDELAQAAPGNWDLVYARVWLATFVDEFEQSLVLMRQLKQQMDESADLSRQQRAENYFRLGRLVGCLQGPYADRVNAASLAHAVEVVLADADDESRQTFDRQRQAVLDQYRQLMANKENKQSTELETLVRKQKVELDQHNALVAQMEKQVMDARSTREQVASQGQAEIARQKERVDQVTSELNQFQSAIASARYDLSAIWVTVQQIDDALAREPDPDVRQRLLWDRNYYWALARDKEFYLGNLRAQANAAHNALGAAAASYDQTVANVQGRVSEIDQSIVSADRTRERSQRKIRSLQAEPKVPNAAVAAIDAEAEALSSYDPFPADLLRQRHLDALAARQ